jgi:thioredoxin reductase (NADPH)
VGETQPTVVSDAANFDPEALWQKGSFALRKLYHDSPRPLLVVYTSPSCGPCHVLKPQLKRVLEELAGQAQGVEIDIEAESEIAQQAGVTGTPTVQLFQARELRQQWRGVRQRSEFRQAIDNLLAVPA